LRILETLGFHVWFRYEKYRQEFAKDDVIVAIDETPIGTFVELEGGEQGIVSAARALGRGQADYLTDSYRGLFLQYCHERGVTATDMLFHND
jgi:adenylate cyclase class 2